MRRPRGVTVLRRQFDLLLFLTMPFHAFFVRDGELLEFNAALVCNRGACRS
jgi:hypothetical protein